MYEALRETAYRERCKIHDLVLEGIDAALKKRGYKGTACAPSTRTTFLST
jgi:hypothetical protein